jgi:hypothetical protein
VAVVHERFDPARAHATVAFAERFFRVRGNEGYHRVIDRVREQLTQHGFPEDRVRTLELGEVQPTWTPRSARLVLVESGTETPIVSFADESERDRACLLVGSDSLAERTIEVVRAEAVRDGSESAEGRLVLAEGRPQPLYAELVPDRRAAGILVRNLESYHQPDRFPDSAQFGYLPPHRSPAEGGVPVVGFSLSDRAWRALRTATEATGVATVRVAVDVATGSSAATAIEATIPGRDASAGAIVFSTHVDEPGANDNGSGVGALAELAGAMRRAILEGAVPPPRRTIVFVWGQEIEVSGEWLDQAAMPVGAGLVMDMVGEDPAAVGAPFLIERMPDPGAVWLRAPDEHSEWGQSEVDPATLRGHFLNDLLRAAIGAVESREGAAWSTRAHPYEGGSDHVSFLRRDLPAVLAWHFTDSAYHTTMDRIDRVSGDEMRRVASVLGGAAFSMASGDPADRAEMLACVRSAALERLEWAERAGREWIAAGGDPDLERRIVREWARWYDTALSSAAGWDGEDAALAGPLRTARGEVAERAARAVEALGAR